VSLSAIRPEVLADQGDSIGAHLRRGRKARGLQQQMAAAALMELNIKSTDGAAAWRRDQRRQVKAALLPLDWLLDAPISNRTVRSITLHGCD